MNYLIAVYKTRAEVVAARDALEKENLPREKITILGEGYKNIDEYGLVASQDADKKNVQVRFTYWLIIIGFAAGSILTLFTNIQFTDVKIIPTNGIANMMIGGFLGGIAGSLSAFIFRGTFELPPQNEDAWLYRDRLNAGKFLIIFRDTEESVKKATDVLHYFDMKKD
ncbi:hypothetical protein Riv7116_3113 [Rivularia sp. PCC 7116]|uniref:hypothetical protein n=1 Tax=Rivularia sp. PCC 7116 TaxID=373994 RepID=UPI00029F18BA|nr:hypothetical protein [Rivularia sp. PCC 7116]AFY55588.1 hypothetical protein Riv7116_3113 [Rivularia sp. PCC 7116]